MINNSSYTKKRYAIKKIIGRAVNSTILAGFLAGTVWTGVEGVKEMIETEKGDNRIIDFDYGLFSIVFKSYETRSFEELTEDLQKAILQVPNIDKAFSEPENLSLAQKEQIIQDIINAMSETGNLITNEFQFKKMGSDGGYYFTIYNNWFSVITKKIQLNEIYMKTQFNYVVNSTIHEMIHAVMNENIMRSDMVTKLDKKAFFTKYGKQQDKMDYISSLEEIYSQLFSARLTTYFEVNYGHNLFGFDIENGIKHAMLLEMILNLYDQEVGTGYDFSFLPIEHTTILKEDEQNYKLLPLKELIKLSLLQKFEAYNVPLKESELENSIFYQLFEHYFSKNLMNVRYVDYLHRNYEININNVSNEIENFENYLLGVNERNKDVTIAEQVALYVNVFRYESNKYSDEDKMLLSNEIFKYLDGISDEHIKQFGLQDASELVSEHISRLNTDDLEEITL